MSPDEAALAAGAAALGVEVDADRLALLLAYLERLKKWNGVYNLTAIRDASQMVTHHLLDSMTVIAPLRRQVPALQSVLDVGSGAGFPGAVIAMLLPEVEVTCVDAVAKKAAFVRQAAAELGLKRLTALHARVEAIAEPKCQVVVSRAFSSLSVFVASTRHLLDDRGCWLAMKGSFPDREIAAAEAAVEVFHVEQVAVPGLHAERHLVWMRMHAETRG